MAGRYAETRQVAQPKVNPPQSAHSGRSVRGPLSDKEVLVAPTTNFDTGEMVIASAISACKA
jgi:hypothetical protein